MTFSPYWFSASADKSPEHAWASFWSRKCSFLEVVNLHMILKLVPLGWRGGADSRPHLSEYLVVATASKDCWWRDSLRGSQWVVSQCLGLGQETLSTSVSWSWCQWPAGPRMGCVPRTYRTWLCVEWRTQGPTRYFLWLLGEKANGFCSKQWLVGGSSEDSEGENHGVNLTWNTQL